MITRKIGLNRGIPRLWLEGSILSTNGFQNGDHFSITNKKDSIVGYALTIVWHSDGDRKIAGKPDRPIIDINGSSILWGFQHGDIVNVSASKGLIVITKLGE